jgi:hypothetical protein
MTRRLIVRVSLSLSLAGVPGGVLAQQTAAPVITGNVIGDCGAGVHAGDATITCGDLNRAPGMTVITPAGVERGPVPMDVVPASEPAPEVEPSPGDEAAPVDESVAETSVEANESDTAIEPDTAVASETDLDADNYPDALELDVGLDPNTVDTDGDGVADGDEGNLYGTDPTVADTDGDGVSDGGELFDLRTAPLLWNDFAAESPDAALKEGAAAGSAPVDAEDVATSTTSVDSDNDRLADADEAAFGTDPTTPDADGDGYYDGDEVNLGTDPLDPASFPTEEHPPSEEQPSSAA